MNQVQNEEEDGLGTRKKLNNDENDERLSETYRLESHISASDGRDPARMPICGSIQMAR